MEKLMRLHRKYVDTPLSAQFPRPAFKVGAAPAAGFVGRLGGSTHQQEVVEFDMHALQVAEIQTAVCLLLSVQLACPLAPRAVCLLACSLCSLLAGLLFVQLACWLVSFS